MNKEQILKDLRNELLENPDAITDDAFWDLFSSALSDYEKVVKRETIEEVREEIHNRKGEWHKTCLQDQFVNGRFWEAQELWELFGKPYFQGNHEEKSKQG